MKRGKQSSHGRKRVIKVWSLDRARKALPLIASIVRSIRDDRLEALAQQRRADLLAARPGRSNREALIAHAEAVCQSKLFAAQFDAGLEELAGLNIYCLDPVLGLALIPFAHQDQLAWLVFDLFEPNNPSAWRYHEDPLSTRRPMAELDGNPATDSLIV